MIEPKPFIKGIRPYPMPEPGRGKKIRLDMNENTRGCSPKVLDAIKRLDPEDIATYPEYGELKRKLAKHHSVDPENIILTNGADDGFRSVMTTYLKPEDEIIIPVPNYPMFEILARQNGTTITDVLYNDDLNFPTEMVLGAITKRTKMVVIVNPGNPTGSVIPEEDLIRILDRKKDTVVLLDETYYQFADKSFIPLIKDYPNLIISQTFSKVFGLAGLRIGFIITTKKNIEDLSKVNLPFPVSCVGIAAASAALDDLYHINEYVREVMIGRNFLYRKLREMNFDVRMTRSNFILLNLKGDNGRIREELKRRNILVKDLDHYPLLKGFIRITIGTHSENLVLLEALKDILNYD